METHAVNRSDDQLVIGPQGSAPFERRNLDSAQRVLFPIPQDDRHEAVKAELFSAIEQGVIPVDWVMKAALRNYSTQEDTRDTTGRELKIYKQKNSAGQYEVFLGFTRPEEGKTKSQLYQVNRSTSPEHYGRMRIKIVRDGHRDLLKSDVMQECFRVDPGAVLDNMAFVRYVNFNRLRARDKMAMPPVKDLFGISLDSDRTPSIDLWIADKSEGVIKALEWFANRDAVTGPHSKTLEVYRDELFRTCYQFLSYAKEADLTPVSVGEACANYRVGKRFADWEHAPSHVRSGRLASVLRELVGEVDLTQESLSQGLLFELD